METIAKDAIVLGIPTNDGRLSQLSGASHRTHERKPCSPLLTTVFEDEEVPPLETVDLDPELLMIVDTKGKIYPMTIWEPMQCVDEMVLEQSWMGGSVVPMSRGRIDCIHSLALLRQALLARLVCHRHLRLKNELSLFRARTLTPPKQNALT